MRTMVGLAIVAMSGVGCSVDTSNAEEQELSEAAQELATNGLNPRQRATVLKLIDDICGDTWCEGDHNFSFDQLVCHRGCGGDAGSCELTFRVFSYDTDIETGPTFARSCKTEEFYGFDSLVETHGSHRALQPSYYEALSECIGRVEADLPR
jgi:hypothetical protein